MCNKLPIVLCCLLFNCFCANAQRDSSDSITEIDAKVFKGLSRQYDNLQSKLHKQSEKLLAKMQQKEARLQSAIKEKDSNKVKQVFTTDIQEQYSALSSKLSSQVDKLKKFPLTEYVAGLDSMQTSLNFLLENNSFASDKLEQISAVAEKLKNFQAELQKANDIQEFVRAREAALKDQLQDLGLVKQLSGINKQVFYYQQQLAEYKSMLNDKQKLKEKLLATIRTLPAFQKFWQKYSYIAALFPMPANAGTQGALAGLQTRASIQTAIAQRIGARSGNGINPMQFFQQQIGVAQAQLNQLKEKLNQFSKGGGSGNMTMPDFKPDDQKTKTFLRRLEYGFNIQSEKGQYGLPTMSDLALTLGYKLSDNKRIGIGASYKIGWGNGIKDIHFSSEGFGLRSYLDIKFPLITKGIFFKGLWLSGGFEYNYLSSFRIIRELHNNVDVWQKSALLGLSKKYRIGKKECNMQLLYDFLYNQQNPPSTALKFRVGYIF